jgi:hypothetical protein
LTIHLLLTFSPSKSDQAHYLFHVKYRMILSIIGAKYYPVFLTT